MYITLLQLPSLLEKPLFEPRYLNMEYLFNKVLQFLDLLRDFFVRTLPLLLENTQGAIHWGLFSIIGWTLSFLFVVGALYALHKIWDLKYEEHKKFFRAERASLEAYDYTEHNLRWKKVTDLLNTQNESDWRLAIMEADNILADLLLKMGYTAGDTVGEKLKTIEPSDFLTLPHAWEAHKIRNRIAHEGASFRLNHREATRVIDLYSKVFEEFHYI